MKVYALKNRKITDSASGAAFPTIVEALKISGGDTELIVYGAAFDDELKVTHQRGETEQDYVKFRGSKYVQSDLGKTYQWVNEDLLQGKKVLFTGTPCQVYGLRHYLETKQVGTENLYLVDIICHGTPNPKIWSDFVEWLENKHGAKIKKFSFRYEFSKWKVYPVMAEFQNGKKLVNTHDVRLYTKLFLRNYIMRDSCYSCKFASLNRPSDLTIGDFWGIDKVMPEFPDKEGVSEVLVNTEKGQQIIKTILDMRSENLIIGQCFSDDYLKYQHNLNAPTVRPHCIDQLREDYKNHGIAYVLAHYAGYNWKGRIKHIITRVLGETGIKNS